MTTRLTNSTVLIVDDDEDILGSIKLAVQAEGGQVATATDGNAALATFKETDPDVVILDMMLPRASGFIVLEKLMELSDPPVVVMLTANLGKRHMAYAQDLGVHAYLTKPVSLERLMETIVDLLHQRADQPAGAEPGD
ncbi:MAG: response regulator transcription factor [Planctomycetota bacterium]|jgi:DNA-binding response OmpR family regulator